MSVRSNNTTFKISAQSIRHLFHWIIPGVIASLAPGAAFGYGSYGTAFDSRYFPQGTQGTVIGNNCSVCHAPYPARNSYGTAFAKSFTPALRAANNIAQAIADIESLDSDGDGVTNIGEIANRKFPGDATDTPPSTVLPGAPTGVSATAGNGQTTVSFNAPGSNGGSTIAAYTVTASPGGATATGTSSPITLTGLTNGTSYTFTVRALTLWGTGTASAGASATPTAPATAPTDVSAVARSGEATVSFTAPADDGGTPITGYTVTSSPGGITASGTSSSIVVAGLTNGTAYTFTVKATNSGGSGPASAASSPVTPAAVFVPVPDSLGSFSFVDAGNGMAILAFDPPADNGSPITNYTALCSYSLVQGVTLSFAASGPASPLIIEGLTNGTTYQCKLTATNAFGTGLAGGNAQFIPSSPSRPGMPTAITAIPGNGQASIAFGAPTNDGGSAILDYTASCKSGSTTLTATGTASPLIVTGLANGTASSCWVTARNAQGTFNALAFRSPTVSVTPSASIFPEAPAGVGATLNGNDIVVSWTAISGVTYNIYMANQSGVAKSNYAALSGGHVHANATSPFAHPSGTPGATYYLSVTAVNSAGESIGSTEASITVPAPVTTTTTTTTTSTTSTTTTTAAPTTTTTTTAPATTTSTAAATTSTTAVATTSTTAAATTSTTAAATTSTTAAATTTTTTAGATTTTTASTTTTTQSQGGATALNLVIGWNLVGNSSDAILNVASAFGDPASTATVWKWVALKNNWAFYTPGLSDGGAAYAASKTYDFLTSVSSGEGFWVNAKSAFSVQLPSGTPVVSASFQSMASGWNLLAIGDNPTPSGFNKALSLTPPVAGDVPINLTTLWAWDSIQNNWYFYAPNLEKSGGLAGYIQQKTLLDFGTKVLDPAMGFWVNKP